MAVATTQGAEQHIRSNLWFSSLPKDTSTCRSEESNQWPSKMLAQPLSHSPQHGILSNSRQPTNYAALPQRFVNDRSNTRLQLCTRDQAPAAHMDCASCCIITALQNQFSFFFSYRVVVGWFFFFFNVLSLNFLFIELAVLYLIESFIFLLVKPGLITGTVWSFYRNHSRLLWQDDRMD